MSEWKKFYVIVDGCESDCECVYWGWWEKFSKFFVFLELRKAFNIVNHKILLSKLKGYNVKGSMLNLLLSYLNFRSQLTVINIVVSEREIVNVGMKQGLLFWSYVVSCDINDIFLLLRLIWDCLLMMPA